VKRRIRTDYRAAFGLTPGFLTVSGDYEGLAPEADLERRVFRPARMHAIQESMRWGEPQIHFVAPGVLSWMVPVVDRYRLVGGVSGGEVRTDEPGTEMDDAVAHLVRRGLRRTMARRFLAALPVWTMERVRAAADFLDHRVYQMTGYQPILLREQKDRAEQQRQIAEEAFRRKQGVTAGFPGTGEEALLSLIRAGDRKGARRILNRMLGEVFSRTSDLTIIRASMIEMMGHLVRQAVEDSPSLEPILAENHLWMARIIEARDFEDLSVVLRSALDDFLEKVYDMEPGDAGRPVRDAMDFLSRHYREPVGVEDAARAAGLSASRISHLVKEQTGRSLIQHRLQQRIREARRLLEESGRSCAEIAAELGFCDQSHFTRQFRRLAGLSPARYRRKVRVRGSGVQSESGGPDTRRADDAVRRKPAGVASRPAAP
jgi:two-component system response regulator YesN